MPALVNRRLASQIERLVGNYTIPIDITIYNAYISSHSQVYQRTQIIADLWSNNKAVNVIQSGGYLEADSASIIISSQRTENLNYVDESAWIALSSKISKWTLRSGDFIVKGHVTDEITGAFTTTSLKEKYDEVLKITSIDIRDLGGVKHWKVGAK
jgi:transcription termination factor Rho